MRLIDRLRVETEGFHLEADEDALYLLGTIKPPDYQRFLKQTFGFVLPLERSIARTPHIDRHVDLRRFKKHQLLRRDLLGFRMRHQDIDQLPQCTVPAFESPQEALGWAYVIERSTLTHGSLFRHLAAIMPGEVAFTSTYLKCNLGTLGESWKTFGDALEMVAPTPSDAQRVIDGAAAAFRVQLTWRHLHDEYAVQCNEEGAVREQRPA